jgi:hypothetical protein
VSIFVVVVRKLLLLFTIAIMDTSRVDYMKASHLSYMHSITNVAATPPEKEYKIPMSAILYI